MSTKPFEIGLVMAGAISAGAYSAGVMDFIIEALDKYYEAKQRDDWDGPRHDVYVPVLAGASAGGMTAAIIALQAFRTIKHVLPGEAPPDAELNRLYSSWVTDIDIKRLLEVDDPREREAVQSVLCCRVLDEIVNKAFDAYAPNKKRPWIGRDDDPLRVFLTVTNLRGLPCSFELFGDENRYGMLNHGDYLDFTVGSKSVAAPGSLALDINDTAGADWDLFRTAAVATGAFPIGLRPRAVNRKAADYSERKECGLDECISGETDYPFVAVDGGMINNEPLELARQYLAERLSGKRSERNPRPGNEATRAVVLIDPFPNLVKLPDPPPREPTFVGLAADIFAALLDQSRFKLDELRLAANEKVFSRYIICPKRAAGDNALAKKYPIASGVLGGFGGFLQETFRRHDYLLGRRNAQAFLRWGFGLPRTNQAMFGAYQINDRWLIRDISQAKDETRSFRYGEDSDLPLKMFFRDENQEQPDTPGFPIIPLVPELCEPIRIGPGDWPQPTLINLDTLEPFIDERMSFVARAVVANELGNLEDALQKKREAETPEPKARGADAVKETTNTWSSVKSFAEDGVACVKRLSSKLGRTVLREAASRYGARIAAQVARDQIAEARDEVERAFKP